MSNTNISNLFSCKLSFPIVVTVAEKSVLPCRLAEMGQHVGSHLLDILFVREKGFKREIKLLSMLIFIKSNFWKVRHYSLHTIYSYNIADPEGELKECHGFEKVSTY